MLLISTDRPIAFTTENNCAYLGIPYFSKFYSGTCINKTFKNLNINKRNQTFHLIILQLGMCATKY